MANECKTKMSEVLSEHCFAITFAILDDIQKEKENES